MSNLTSSLRVQSQNFQTATQLCDEICSLALRYDLNFKDVLPLIKKQCQIKELCCQDSNATKIAINFACASVTVVALVAAFQRIRLGARYFSPLVLVMMIVWGPALLGCQLDLYTSNLVNV